MLSCCDYRFGGKPNELLDTVACERLSGRARYACSVGEGERARGITKIIILRKVEQFVINMDHKWPSRCN